ncbi:MAG: DMT family transporter [Alphaproteobacteria bacterium]|nr:DMT family transporter [Alphaproteobacteria bacterium]
MRLKKIDTASDNPLYGILLYSGCVLCFALLGTAARYFNGVYPVNELIFFRSIVTIFIILGSAAWKKNKQIFKTNRPKIHFLRSLIGFSALTLLTLSYMELPLADASTIQYTSPFFVALFAWPILGERISMKQAIAILVGFSGIFFAFNPDLDNLNMGMVYGFLGTILTSLVSIFLRDMGKTENPITTVLYFNCICALISGGWLLYNWVTPSFSHVLLFLMLGVIAYFAQTFFTHSYKWAPAGLLAPFNYVGIIWYGALGYLIFGDLPSNTLLIGCSLVVCSGLYMVYLEIQKKKMLNHASYGQIRR